MNRAEVLLRKNITEEKNNVLANQNNKTTQLGGFIVS